LVSLKKFQFNKKIIKFCNFYNLKKSNVLHYGSDKYLIPIHIFLLIPKILLTSLLTFRKLFYILYIMSSSKRHFTVVINSKEHGLYSSLTPSSAARKAVSKLCADNKNKKFEFYIREITQRSNKKVYGPYIGYMQKLDKPIELKGRVIRYKPIAKLKKKSQKMKGGVIIGEGKEGVVLRPNINQSPNNKTTVSKLITATPEQIEQLIKFENRLNEIDEDGKYHVKMLGYRDITSENINRISNVNKSKKNEMKKFNFKITYEFGGISIEKFLENFKESYSQLVNRHFIQALLRGILNCFKGLYEFNSNGIVHVDLNEGNIVFFLDHPEIMRIIDWGNLLESNNSHNIIESLYNFYANIKLLINQLKVTKTDDTTIKEILDNFLVIKDFDIYKSRATAKILDKSEFDKVKIAMQALIEKL